MPRREAPSSTPPTASASAGDLARHLGYLRPAGRTHSDRELPLARAEHGRQLDAARHAGPAYPLVGGALSTPFKALASTSRDLAQQAQDYQDAVERFATLAGFLVAGFILLILVLAWLPRRVAWIGEASAASRLVRRTPGSADLLAVRALARQPLRRLAKLGPEVVEGWKAGDPEATERLAGLELDERPRL